MHLELIGDELYWRGYLIAVLAPEGVPASAMAEFVDGMETGSLFGTEDADETRREFVKRAKQLSKGGLIKYAALDVLAQEMEDE